MTIKWGDPIECNGVRPDWLRDGEEIQFENTTDEWLNGPAGRYTWDARDECPISIRLPADHPAYVALARGFTPWSGGESAPDDWDGGTVLVLDGCGTPAQWKEPREINTAKLENWSGEGNAVQIIGYRKRNTALPFDRGEMYVRIVPFTRAEWDAVPDYTAWAQSVGLIRPETNAERFTRETGHAVTEAVEAALNWKET